MNAIVFQPLGNAIAAGDDRIVGNIDPRLTRTNYFDGRLLTAEDLTRDQLYLDQRLREVGRVLGSGIMRGLELSFERLSGRLTVQPGQAITPAGRVLELGTGLVVNLGDRALIGGLNRGRSQRFDRGLYAVVLSHVEVGTDIAEVFPRDLGATRGAQYATITESVQLGLVPLPVPLSQQNPLQLRARLLREMLRDDPFASLIPEDAVPLGILAIQNDTPQWADGELLRHPVRAEAGPGDLQADLSRQYEALLGDVLSTRLSAALSGDFHATEYFSVLPPVGSLPKETIDPAAGRQRYFPENYQVSIAPIRLSDVEQIKAESLSLPPIDLTSTEPLDIMVLAPLSNVDFSHYAMRLEREFDATTRRLPQLDLLRLRLYPLHPVHAIDTDAGVWSEIWARLGDSRPLYVRRPSRAAETAISGIVLATAAMLPGAPPATTGPADAGGLILDETEVFLKSLDLATLGQLRPASGGAPKAAFDALTAGFGHDVLVIRNLARALMLIERRYDTVVWQTLRALAESGGLDGLIEKLLAGAPAASTARVIADAYARSGLPADVLALWTAIVAAEPGP